MDDSRILDREVNPFEPIVNDGLLGGSLVETDAEILKLPGLSRRDRVQFGSTEDMTVLELADRTGVIGSQPEKSPLSTVLRGSLWYGLQWQHFADAETGAPSLPLLRRFLVVGFLSR